MKKVVTSSEGTASKASVLRGYLAFLQGEVFRAMHLLQQSLDKLPPEDNLFRNIATWLLSYFSIATGDFNTGSQALEILVQTSLQKNHIIITAGALCALAEVHIRMGQLRQAKDDYEHALVVARDSRGLMPIAARAQMGLGELWREWNDLEIATRYCLEGIELAKRLSEVSAITGYITLARIRLARGEWQGSHLAIQKARELALQTLTSQSSANVNGSTLTKSQNRSRMQISCSHLAVGSVSRQSRRAFPPAVGCAWIEHKILRTAA